MLLFLLLCSDINAYKCCTCDIFLSVLGWYHHDIRGALSLLRLLKLKGKFLYLKNSVVGGRNYAKDWYILFLIGNHDNVTFQWLLLGPCCNILLSLTVSHVSEEACFGRNTLWDGIDNIILYNDVTFHQSLHGTHCNHGNSYFSALIRLEVRTIITGMRAVDLYIFSSILKLNQNMANISVVAIGRQDHAFVATVSHWADSRDPCRPMAWNLFSGINEVPWSWTKTWKKIVFKLQYCISMATVVTTLVLFHHSPQLKQLAYC